MAIHHDTPTAPEFADYHRTSERHEQKKASHHKPKADFAASYTDRYAALVLYVRGFVIAAQLYTAALSYLYLAAHLPNQLAAAVVALLVEIIKHVSLHQVWVSLIHTRIMEAKRELFPFAIALLFAGVAFAASIGMSVFGTSDVVNYVKQSAAPLKLTDAKTATAELDTTAKTIEDDIASVKESLKDPSRMTATAEKRARARLEKLEASRDKLIDSTSKERDRVADQNARAADEYATHTASTSDKLSLVGVPAEVFVFFGVAFVVFYGWEAHKERGGRKSIASTAISKDGSSASSTTSRRESGDASFAQQEKQLDSRPSSDGENTVTDLRYLKQRIRETWKRSQSQPTEESRDYNAKLYRELTGKLPAFNLRAEVTGDSVTFVSV